MRRKLFSNKQFMIGFLLILIMLACAFFAVWIAPNDPYAVDISKRFLSPSKEFPFGTDQMGRCILSCTIYGARTTLSITFLALTIIAVIAIPAGIFAAYKGKWFDKIFVWLCDVCMAFPPIVLVLALTGIIGTGITNLMLSTILAMWGWYSRLVRSYTISEKSKGYITAASLCGVSPVKSIFIHILPNIAPSVVVLFTLGVADMILMTSSYSFLGIGFPVELPEWGTLIREGKSNFASHPGTVLLPGICVVLTVCGFNLVGESLRDIFSPYGGRKNETYT